MAALMYFLAMGIIYYIYIFDHIDQKVIYLVTKFIIHLDIYFIYFIPYHSFIYKYFIYVQ